MAHEMTLTNKFVDHVDRGTSLVSYHELQPVCSCGWEGRAESYGHTHKLKDGSVETEEFTDEIVAKLHQRAEADAQAHLGNPLMQDAEADDLWDKLRAARKVQRQADHEVNVAKDELVRHLVKINEFHVGDEVMALMDHRGMGWRRGKLTSVTFVDGGYGANGRLVNRQPIYAVRIYVGDGFTLSEVDRSAKALRPVPVEGPVTAV